MLKLKKIIYIYIPFIFLFIILILLHYYWHAPNLDDLYFAKRFNTLFILNNSNFIMYRYTSWTSRSLIEFFLVILSYLPPVIWKLLDSLLFLIIAVLTPKIILSNFERLSIKKKFTYNIISSILLLIFIWNVFHDLGSAGYISTTLNYIWPFGFAVIHFYLIKKYIFKKVNMDLFKKTCIYSMMIFSLLFAINMEIMLVVVFGVYVFIFIYLQYKKIKIPKIMLYFYGIVILGFMNSLLCPGNHERYFSELKTWFPKYSTFSLFNKIDLATTTLFYNLITKFNPISYIFFAILGIYTFIISKKKKISYVGFIPIFLLTFFYFMLFIQFKPLINLFSYGFHQCLLYIYIYIA
ncbi:MAG: DUF6056 family protein [Methanobrevibacter sp.]|nr:DUF6056 family protein [Methanobrevibacter sp.]